MKSLWKKKQHNVLNYISLLAGKSTLKIALIFEEAFQFVLHQFQTSVVSASDALTKLVDICSQIYPSLSITLASFFIIINFFPQT